MSFSFSTGVVDLDEFVDPRDAIKLVMETKCDEIPEGTGRDEAVALQHGIVEAAIDAAGLVRGYGKHVSFNVNGHGHLVDGTFTTVSLSVSATRAIAPESETIRGHEGVPVMDAPASVDES